MSLFLILSRQVGLLLVALLGWNGHCAAQAAMPDVPQQRTPAWAYPLLPTAAPPSVADDGIRHALPASSQSFTRSQLFDLFTAHDWFPDMHPPMPEVVARGRRPKVRACGMCHYPNGQGRPENAALAGLPAGYIVQQFKDYKLGLRRSSEAQAGPQLRMLSTALHATDEEIEAAAQYFSGLTYRPWITVIEADQVPLTRVVIGSMWAAIPGDTREPIADRIVEVPTDLARTELRDPRSGFTAYVPVGSLAGRSPQYMYRQLHDMRGGSRHGAAAAAMRDVLARLTPADMLAVVAYAASLEP